VRKFHRTVAITSAVALAAVTAAGCTVATKARTGSAFIAATAAYVQVPDVTGKTTVGYLDIRNNGAADELESVTTSVGGTVSLRAPERPGASPVVMHTVPGIPVPANTTTQLVPNNYHLLISGQGPMYDGKDITLKLKFAHAGTISILALVTNPQNGGSSYFLN
jgi:copper(I)-binding protein